MAKKRETVVLHLAYVWDCPACGRKDIFGHTVEAELTEAEKQELARMMGDDDTDEWKGEPGEARQFIEGGGLVTNPKQVTCPQCNEVCDVFCEPDERLPDGFDPHRDLNP